MVTESNFNPLESREIELYTNGEYKRLGYVREMNTATEFDEFQTIYGEVNRIPRETRTSLEIELYNPDAMRMFTEMVQQIRINNTVMFVIVKSWDMSVGMYENILKLEIVVTDTVDTSETYEIPAGATLEVETVKKLEKLTQEDHSFKEELL